MSRKEFWNETTRQLNEAFAAQEAQMRECMGNRENYDIEAIRSVVAYYETNIGKDCHGAKVARAILAERLAEMPPKIDWAFVDSIDPAHQDRLELALRLRSLMDMQADFAERGKLVLLEKTKALIDSLCADHQSADDHHADCLCNDCTAGIGDSPN